ncbi:MAG: TonB-dependent receptor [Marinobacterium sp.]|nr:TonB-dependent receptor [Marinobacterium sp.]
MYARALLSATLGLALSPLTIAIQAQAAEDDAAVSLNAVVITGETLSRDLQRTASSVAVLTGEELERASDVTLYDSFNRVVNLTPVASSGGFAIRGITQTGPGGAGNGRTINISIDGASLPTTQATFFGPYSGWDLQQVEVLRGPQSTQQGRNALAGAINIRSADPEFEQYGKVRLRAGSHSSSGLAVMYNQPLNDEVAVRFAGEYSRSDGWVENPTRNEDDYDARQLSLGRFKVLYEPSDDLRVVLSHSASNNEGGEDYIDYLQFPGKRYNYSDEAASEYSKHRNTGLRINYNLNDLWSLESETTLYDHDYRRLEDYDGLALPGGLLDRFKGDRGVSQEVKFIYDNGSNTRGAVGVYATRIEAGQDDFLIGDASLVDPRIPAGSATFSRIFDRQTDTDNLALFGELDYDLNNQWTLTAGARYDYEKIQAADVTRYTLTPQIITLPEGAETNLSTSFKAFLPKAAVTYHWNEDINTSFTIQRGYRAGGNDINPFTLEPGQFDPEYTWNYELALRSTLLDGRMTFNGNLFYTDWEDQQVRVYGPSGNSNDSYITNAGKSSLYGAELEMRLQATEQLQLAAGIGYTHTKFDEFVNANTDFSGNEFPYAPELTAFAGGEYRLTEQWFVQLDGSFTDNYYSVAANEADKEVPARFIINGRVGYETPDWSAVLFARNLTDKDYYTQRNDIANVQRIRSGEPLTLGVEVSASF